MVKANVASIVARLDEADSDTSALLKQFAAEYYHEAVATAGVGDVSSMRRNVSLLRDHVDGADGILRILDVGSVVVFSGHMIDHPLRTSKPEIPPRLPNDPRLLEAVNQAIRKELDDLNATVGYCSAACGSDLMFAEQWRSRGRSRPCSLRT